MRMGVDILGTSARCSCSDECIYGYEDAMEKGSVYVRAMETITTLIHIIFSFLSYYAR